MTLRRRLLLALTLIAAVVVAMVAVTVLAAGRFETQLRRTELAYEQRQSITMLAVQAFNYKTIIREVLLDGRGSPAMLELARGDIEGTLQDLAAQTAEELAILSGAALEEEREESERLGRLQARFADIGALVDRIAVLQQSGDAEAAALLAETADTMFAGEVSDQLTAALADEQAEVVEADAQTAALATTLVAALVAAGLAAVAVIVGTGIGLDRAITRPLRRLLAGVDAVAGGDLAHRIAWQEGRDELASLARRFDAMAAALQHREAELVAARAGLEREVAERTGELAETNRRLTVLDRQRLLFLADVSHELRTPITILRGEAEVTLRHGADAPAPFRDALERIIAQAEQMSLLIQDLLFLARSEADTVSFRMERSDLGAIVAVAADAGRSLTRGRAVTVREELPAEPVWARADPQRLRQAILIALDNAARYADDEQPIVVSLAAEPGEAVIRVMDRGAGIPAEDLPYVFERFYRIRDGGRPDGSGLGLSIAKWITEKHGGRITLESSPGAGTTLTIRLPLEAP